MTTTTPYTSFDVLSEYPEFDARIEVFDADRAKEVLKQNTKNRPLRKLDVNMFRNDMQTGNWLLTMEPIVFDTRNDMLDGQHRMHALAGIEDDTTVRFLVIYGADPDSFLAMGQNVKRTLADTLFLKEYKNPMTLAAVARLHYRWFMHSGNINDSQYTGLKLSNANGVQWIEDHPNLVVAANYAKQKQNQKFRLLPPSAIGLLQYLFFEISPDDCNQFFGRLVSGEGLLKNDPEYMLRRRLENIREQSRNEGMRPRPHMLISLTIKAWNACREGRQISRLVHTYRDKMPLPV